jgi:hypothetical protein
MADLKLITKVAERVRDEMVNEDDPPMARCLVCARALVRELRKNKIRARVISGTFAVDNPNQENYDEWNPNDFNSEEEMEDAKHHPLHYWAEIISRPLLIVDISADQFNEELDDEIAWSR